MLHMYHLYGIVLIVYKCDCHFPRALLIIIRRPAIITGWANANGIDTGDISISSTWVIVSSTIASSKYIDWTFSASTLQSWGWCIIPDWCRYDVRLYTSLAAFSRVFFVHPPSSWTILPSSLRPQLLLKISIFCNSWPSARASIISVNSGPSEMPWKRVIQWLLSLFPRLFWGRSIKSLVYTAGTCML